MTHDHDPDFTNPKLNGAQAMTTTRRASTLCPRDKGRAVEGVDTEGAPFAGVLTGGNFAGDQLTLWIGRNPIEVHLDAWVHVTGSVVPPEPQYLERNLPA